MDIFWLVYVCCWVKNSIVCNRSKVWSVPEPSKSHCSSSSVGQYWSTVDQSFVWHGSFSAYGQLLYAAGVWFEGLDIQGFGD